MASHHKVTEKWGKTCQVKRAFPGPEWRMDEGGYLRITFLSQKGLKGFQLNDPNMLDAY